jgi:hypothetical protein
MPQQIDVELFTKTIRALLEETFEKVDGIYLDGGTSLLETLATLSATEASRPITEAGTSAAGQVYHARFYLRVLNDYMDGQWHEKVNWIQSWQCKSVSESEWDQLRHQLKDDYQKLNAKFQGIADWNDDRRLGGALAIIVHTAYHLGAIRQILRVIKA